MPGGTAKNDQNLIGFATAVKEILPEEGPDCLLSAPDIAAGNAHADMIVYIVQHWYPAVVKFMKKATNLKNMALRGKGSALLEIPAWPEIMAPPAAVPPGSLTYLINLVTRMNLANSDNHKLAGLDLNLVRRVRNVVNRDFPLYSGSCTQGPNYKIGRIDFKKHNHLGVQIESRLFGSQEWQPLGIEAITPYLDTRPLKDPGVPEIREYRLRYWRGGVPDGEWGPVLAITILP